MIDIINGLWFGVRIWIWLYLILSIILGGVVAIYFFREAIKRKYFEVRFPEKLLKVIVHHKNNMYNVYWRLIPDDNIFRLAGKDYSFDNKTIQKENDFFVKGTAPTLKIRLDGKDYDYKDGFQVKNRWKKYAEVHYFFNCPHPISYDMSKVKVDLSSKQLKDFKENDLFTKLLTVEAEKNMMIILMIMTVINIGVSVAVLGKLLEWF